MRALLLAGAVMLGWSTVARATVIEYTTQASFNAAVPSLATNTFVGLPATGTPVASPYTYGPLTFTSAGGDIYAQNDGSYGNNVRFLEIFGSNGEVLITLAQAASAVSFDIGTYGGSDKVAVAVNSVPQLKFSTSAGAPSTTFIGFTDTDLISTIAFRADTQIELDIISFQIAPIVTDVPEPTSLALLALPMGLAGLIVARRRRSAGEA